MDIAVTFTLEQWDQLVDALMREHPLLAEKVYDAYQASITKTIKEENHE